jgi:hypothetical protein
MWVSCRRHQVVQDRGEAAELDEVEFGELRDAVLAPVGELQPHDAGVVPAPDPTQQACAGLET